MAQAFTKSWKQFLHYAVKSHSQDARKSIEELKPHVYIPPEMPMVISPNFDSTDVDRTEDEYTEKPASQFNVLTHCC